MDTAAMMMQLGVDDRSSSE